MKQKSASRTLSSWPRRLHRSLAGEEGFALAAVVLLGAVMLILTAVIIARGIAQSDIEASDQKSEQALHAAESALETFLVTLAAAPDPDQLTTGHLSAGLPDKAAVIEAAETLAQASPSVVLDVPEGEALIIKPSDERRVYAVGFSPTVGSGIARVVEIGYDMGIITFPNWSADYAVQTGGDLDVKGSAHVTGSNANVHANGGVTAASASNIDGCGTESIDTGFFKAGCPFPALLPPQPLPLVVAEDAHYLATYELCPDGARYGPAHISYSLPAGSKPCSAPLTIAPPSGWSGGGSSWSVNGYAEGVFYVYRANVSGTAGVTTGPPSGQKPAKATIIVAKDYGPGESADNCPPQGVGGKITLNGPSWIEPHPSAILNAGETGMTLIAEGDVHLNGGSTITGMILAREDWLMNGNSTIVGNVIVNDLCADDVVFNGDEVTFLGNSTLESNGIITTPFTGYVPDSASFALLDRKEL